MDKDMSFGSKVGQFIGNLFIACLAACVSAVVIALTARFIMWLF